MKDCTERRYIDDEFAYADFAEWLDAHGLTQDRRRVNIITVNNSEPSHDGYCCNQAEEQA
jgi:hypothetical protein